MLRFNIGRIPVQVHPGHFAVAAVLGLQSLQGLSARDAAILLVSWIAIVFASVLLHELGHALVCVAFGYRPAIQLVWTGGFTQPNAVGQIPWQKDVLLTLAGPVLGLVFGAVCIAINRFANPSSGYLQFILNSLIWVNVGWSVINLLPVLPMDGGRIAHAVLIRLFGRAGFLVAQLIALLISAAAVAWLLAVSRQPYMLIIFLMFGLRAFGGVAAYFRGEIPDPHSAALIPLTNAQNLYGQGQLDAAKKLAQQALEEAVSDPKLQSRAHRLLGWIAVKEGKGREALDHFSQVHGQSIEPQALAAAFSLVGDEERALPSWELAYKQMKDPTILHEWGGALIRANRIREARALPGIDMSLAYTCAERVLFIRGDFAAAAKVGLAALEQYPRAETAYDVACALARSGDSEGAMRLLHRAAELGFRKAGLAASDPDLAPLHTDARFHAWLLQLAKSEAR